MLRPSGLLSSTPSPSSSTDLGFRFSQDDFLLKMPVRGSSKLRAYSLYLCFIEYKPIKMYFTNPIQHIPVSALHTIFLSILINCRCSSLIFSLSMMLFYWTNSFHSTVLARWLLDALWLCVFRWWCCVQLVTCCATSMKTTWRLTSLQKWSIAKVTGSSSARYTLQMLVTRAWHVVEYEKVKVKLHTS